jgi:rfaE bifunctional protein kinase chain/domain
VLIIGDVMIDSYIWGNVTRISPEAPVPIVNVKKTEKRLGGAANVALNVKSMGATPILCSIVGNDEESSALELLLSENNITHEGIIKSESRQTTIKHRVLAGSQHILRIDAEIDTPINDEDTASLFEKIQFFLPQIDVIIFEDYDKGVITKQLIEKVIKIANEKGIPTVIDPKKRNFMYYAGATLFKPNLKELREGIKKEITNGNIDELREAIHALKAAMNVKSVLVTLSEHGVFLTDFNKEIHIPAHRREIADVSGAGDTVVSVAALCLASNMSNEEVAQISNLAGGLVCEYLGVVPIQSDVLLAEYLQLFS